VAHLSAPIQALNLVEYVKATGTVVDLAIIGDPATETTVPQILRILDELLPGLPVHVRQRTGFGWADGAHWDATFTEMLTVFERLGRPVGTFVIGEWRARMLWQLANHLGLRGDQLVVLDEGTATLYIDRTPDSEWERELLVPQPNLKVSDRMPRGITFFTAYDDVVRAAGDDTVIPNRYPTLSEEFRRLPVHEDEVIVIGSPFFEANVVLAGDVELTLDLLDQVRRDYPGARLAYSPHRRERAEKLDALREHVDVLTVDLPFEFVPVQLGYRPAAFAGFTSSLMGNLADLIPDDRSEVRVYLLPAEVLATAGRHLVPDYEFLGTHRSGRVRVVATPPKSHQPSTFPVVASRP
jgi:hypothetical protein